MLCFNPGQAECAKRLNPPHPAGVLNPYRSLKSHPCRVDSSTPPFFPPTGSAHCAQPGAKMFFFVFFWSLLVRHVWPRLCIPFRTPLGLFWTSFSSHFGFIFGRKLVLETAFRFFNDFLKLLSNTFIVQVNLSKTAFSLEKVVIFDVLLLSFLMSIFLSCGASRDLRKLQFGTFFGL